MKEGKVCGCTGSVDDVEILIRLLTLLQWRGRMVICWQQEWGGGDSIWREGEKSKMAIWVSWWENGLGT